MINSIYETLDAYKRQGRINVPAAMKTLRQSDETEARRTAIDPEMEFTIDALALCNSCLGKYINQRPQVTWKALRETLLLCRARARDYWECKGWQVPIAEELVERMRQYMGLCTASYYEKRREEQGWFDRSVTTFGQVIGAPEDAVRWIQRNGLWLFLPECIRGLRDDDLSYMFEMYDHVRDGYAVEPGNYQRIYYKSEFDLFEIYSKVSFTRDGVPFATYYATTFEEAIRQEFPALHRWCYDPANPEYHIDGITSDSVLYMVVTNRAIYFFGPGGKVFPAPQIPWELLWNTWLDVECCAGHCVPHYYTGAVIDPRSGTLTATEEITQGIFERVGYVDGGLATFDYAMKAFNRKCKMGTAH